MKKTGLDTEVCPPRQRLANVDAVVLPGVGNFREGAKNLQLLKSDVDRLVETGVPLFGICLGMQLLFEYSDEGSGNGLGLLEGKVLRLPRHVKTPHMGWNTLRLAGSCELLAGIDEEDYFYFVHSYYPDPTNNEVIAARTDYGVSFASVVASKNVYGAQFHPEKSGEPGERVLRNFAEIIKR